MHSFGMGSREFLSVVFLCIVGGWVDADTYLRFNTFAGAMNGNTILLGLSLIRRSPQEFLYHAAIIAAFVCGIVSARLGIGQGAPRGAFLVLAALLIAGSGFAASPWIAALTAFALGAQNAAVRSTLGISVNTAFITGNIARFAEALPEASAPTPRRRVWILAFAWISYGIGAVLGVIADPVLQRFAFCIPASLVLISVALLPRSVADAERKPIG